MGALSPILRSVSPGMVAFWCPGCDCSHAIGVKDGCHGPKWGFDGNASAPTFTPSILVTYNGRDAGIEGAPPAICHSFVNSGQIQFLGDCTHALAGQTVAIPNWPDPERDDI